jgi:hypothetical protein
LETTGALYVTQPAHPLPVTPVLLEKYVLLPHALQARDG